jgi:hypothetical protein
VRLHVVFLATDAKIVNPPRIVKIGHETTDS